MKSLTLDVYCPVCQNRHLAEVDWQLVTGGHTTIAVTCPHCDKCLLVTYEVRGAVTWVRPAGIRRPATAMRECHQ